MLPETWNALSWMFLAVFAGLFVVGPIGRAIADRLRGKSAAVPPGLQDQLDEMLVRLEGLQRQVGEVAERQEITERLLSQVRERGQLGPGNGR